MKSKMVVVTRDTLRHILPERWFNKLAQLIQPVLYSYTYNQDGLATYHNCDFMKDELFIQSYKCGKNTGAWVGGVDIHWRVYVACWAANKAKRLEGDFVECGVSRGGISMAVMHYTNFRTLRKKFYLLDTFCGLSEKYISEEEKEYGIGNEGFRECYDTVKETFREFENVEIIRGTVPDTLPLVEAEKVSYLSIDMNCAAPEIAAGEFFWDKLVVGAVIVLDDYGFAKHVVQKRAWDDFASRKGVQVLSLPTGQGLIFKD